MTKPLNQAGFLKARKSIIEKILDVARRNQDLADEELLQIAEKETKGMFDLLQPPPHSATGPSGSADPKRNLRRGKESRAEHVGRFFLNLMEEPLRNAEVEQTFIPVFAESVYSMLGQEDYEKFSKKIDQLLSFAKEKNFTYEQALDSKPGKGITQSIMTMYRDEMAKYNKFGDRLKIKLEAAMMENMTEDQLASLNIQDTIDKGYAEFEKLINQAAS